MTKIKRGSKSCPRFGSTDIFWTSNLPQLWGFGTTGICYRGALIIEDRRLTMKIRGDYLKEYSKEQG
ncbi:MAG: hypothetical protein H3Z50_05315 [archaeon]|nr:hypothetical protein [archaeon]